MIINVKVFPNSKNKKIVKNGDEIKVYLKSKPERGKANRELIDVLSKYFKVEKSKIRIIKGEKSRRKVVEVNM